MKKLIVLRDKLMDGFLEILYIRLNGLRGDKRLLGNVNVCFRFIEGEFIFLLLDFKGVCVLSGSVCILGLLDLFYVLFVIGFLYEIVYGLLRFIMGEGLSEEDVDYVFDVVLLIIERLRNMLLLWDDFIKKGEN